MKLRVFMSALLVLFTRDDVTGVIMVDEERCVGCWTCILVCPFGAIRRDSKQRKTIKCDLCEGENVPVCVTHCPNEALVYVEVQDGRPNLESKLIAAV